MTERPDADDLRLAFQALTDVAPADSVDLERVWSAVSGESPAEERRAVVEKVAQDASWAFAWRVAHELWTASRDAEGSRRTASRWSNVGWGALAAGLIAAAGLGIWIGRAPARPVDRQGATDHIESLRPEGLALRRTGAVLRWKGPPAATYDLRVSSEDLLHVHTASGLKEGEYLLPAEFLAPLPDGARILWQVEAHLPDGETLRSETFVMKLE